MLEIKENTFVKSPLNYVGGKFKLLPQILPLFPEEINTFVDLFCGGGNVGVNVKANNVLCNDKEKVVIDFLHNCANNTSTQMIDDIEQIINTYKLSKTNKEGYLKIREDYNNGDKRWQMFYSMLVHAFNYQIRFNKSGGYNMPFGKDKSWFNPNLRGNFIKFVDRMNSINIRFTNNDFRKLKPDKLNSNDFVYLDPPYLITVASYNESDGWNKDLENDLYILCDKLNDNGIKFAMSNVTYHKGKSNDSLIEWSKKYKVHELNYTYKNSNYQTKDRSDNGSVEVLITNY